MVKRMTVVRECNPKELKEWKSFGSLRRSARGQSTTCKCYAGEADVVVRVLEYCSCCGDQTSVVDASRLCRTPDMVIRMCLLPFSGTIFLLRIIAINAFYDTVILRFRRGNVARHYLRRSLQDLLRFAGWCAKNGCCSHKRVNNGQMLSNE